MNHASLHRRLSPLVDWVNARIALLDAEQRYEESFALSEEFRDWIVCLDDHGDRIDVLTAPQGTAGRGTACPGGEAVEVQAREQQAAD